MTGPTPRQLAVLQARCETGNAKEAAHQLRISPATVRAHLRNLRDRCGCNSLEQACYRHFGPGRHERVA